MSRALVWSLAVAVAIGLAPSFQAADPPEPPPDRVHEAVVKALATGGDIPGQARNLVLLAWPSGKRDEAVSARARTELGNFGSYAIPALRDAMNSVPQAYTGEVMATALEARDNSRVEMKKEYVAIAIDALWVGNHEAKDLAIHALAMDRTAFAVAPMIDSALADPSLAPTVVGTLGELRYQQARFYLEKVMMEGPPTLRAAAAMSLARIGSSALTPLKKALKADDRETRLVAVRAILPVATEYELGALYEYIEKYGNDDPELTRGIQFSAVAIEKAIAARDAKAAADNPKDF